MELETPKWNIDGLDLSRNDSVMRLIVKLIGSLVIVKDVVNKLSSFFDHPVETLLYLSSNPANTVPNCSTTSSDCSANRSHDKLVI